ncbi:hypothetical protein LXL04_000591 [Taraxacum kok-saghyz]
MDEVGPSIEESDRGPFYDSNFEHSDCEDGSSTASERGFVVDEELEDSEPDDVVSFKLPTDAFLYDFCHPPLPKDKKILEDELIKEEGIAGMENEADGPNFLLHTPDLVDDPVDRYWEDIVEALDIVDRNNHTLPSTRVLFTIVKRWEKNSLFRVQQWEKRRSRYLEFKAGNRLTGCKYLIGHDWKKSLTQFWN